MHSSPNNPFPTKCQVCLNDMAVMRLVSPATGSSGTNVRHCRTCRLVYLTDDSIKNSPNFNLLPPSPTLSLSSNPNSPEQSMVNSLAVRLAYLRSEALLLSLPSTGLQHLYPRTYKTLVQLLSRSVGILRAVKGLTYDDQSNSETNGEQSTQMPTLFSYYNLSPVSDQK